MQQPVTETPDTDEQRNPFQFFGHATAWFEHTGMEAVRSAAVLGNCTLRHNFVVSSYNCLVCAQSTGLLWDLCCDQRRGKRYQGPEKCIKKGDGEHPNTFITMSVLVFIWELMSHTMDIQKTSKSLFLKKTILVPFCQSTTKQHHLSTFKPFQSGCLKQKVRRGLQEHTDRRNRFHQTEYLGQGMLLHTSDNQHKIREQTRVHSVTIPNWRDELSNPLRIFTEG